MEKKYRNIGRINIEKIGEYKEKVVTDEVILTHERLNNHILRYHEKEYEQIGKFVTNIIEEPDYIIEDNAHIDTLIFLKNIEEINKKARVVVKLAVDENDKIYTKNSIITMMRLRDKSWDQVLKNRGKILYENTGQKQIKIV